MQSSPRKPVFSSIPGFIESRWWAGPLVAAIVIAAAHATFIVNGFIWLDHGDIEQGRALIPLSQWWLAFSQPYGFTGFYRPFVELLHSLDFAAWGTFAPGFHLTNILLHVAAALAVPLFVAVFLPLSRVERCIAALIFGLHPLALLPAGGISFRSESLMALFVSLAVWSYAKSRSSTGRQWPVLLAATTASACFSKETSFFYLPFFFGAWELSRFVNRWAKPARSTDPANFLVPAIAAAIALGAAAWLRSAAMPAAWIISAPRLTLGQGIGMRLLVLAWQAGNLLSPLPPRVSDVVPMVGVFHAIPLLAATIIAAAAFFAIRSGLRSGASVTLMLVAISLLPALDLLPLPRFYSPHYAYFAVAPVSGGVLLLLRKAAGVKLRLAAQGLVAVWLAAAFLSTAAMGGRFKSDLAFFAPEVAKDPRFSEAWFYIGNHHKAERDFDAANNAYDSGLCPAPETVRFFDPLEFLINKSSVAVQSGRLEAADSLMLIAQATSPAAMQPNIAFIRADIAGRMKRYDTVIALLYGKEECLQRPEACGLLATALTMRGHMKEAEDAEAQGERREQAAGR